jgi:hypothetical protein
MLSYKLRFCYKEREGWILGGNRQPLCIKLNHIHICIFICVFSWTNLSKPFIPRSFYSFLWENQQLQLFLIPADFLNLWAFKAERRPTVHSDNHCIHFAIHKRLSYHISGVNYCFILQMSKLGFREAMVVAQGSSTWTWTQTFFPCVWCLFCLIEAASRPLLDSDHFKGQATFPA